MEKFYCALLASLACLVSELLIGSRHRGADTPIRGGARVRGKVSVPRMRAVASTIATISCVAGTPAATPQGAVRVFEQGDFAKAQQEYAAKQPAKAGAQEIPTVSFRYLDPAAGTSLTNRADAIAAEIANGAAVPVLGDCTDERRCE